MIVKISFIAYSLIKFPSFGNTYINPSNAGSKHSTMGNYTMDKIYCVETHFL